MWSVLVLCIGILYFWLHHDQKHRHKLPPALPGWLPLIGHTHILLGSLSDLWAKSQLFAQQCNDLGGVVYADFAFHTHYIITDPDDALTAANSCLDKHFLYDFLRLWLGNGLILAPVDIWKRHRRLMMPTFSLPVVHTFLDVFNNQSKMFVRDLACHVGKGHFRHRAAAKKITLQTFTLTALGIDAAEDVNFGHKYMEAVESMTALATIRFQKPWLHSDFLFRLFGYKKLEAELVAVLNEMSNEMIQRKKMAMEIAKKNNKVEETIKTGKTYKALLHLLLELASDGSLSDKDIRDHIDTSLVAGYNSSSNTLMCMLIMIGAHPEVQQRMYEEIIQVVGTERDVDKEDIYKLEYLEAVILETLRVYPTAPVLPRRVNSDVKLKNYTMRAGTYCAILPTGLHLNQSWGDSNKFRPERWLNTDALPKNSFIGFSLGKRDCIGETYALTSLKVTLVHFLRKYRVQASKDCLQLSILITLQVEGTIAIYNRI